MKILIGMPCMATIPYEVCANLIGLNKPKDTFIEFVSNSLVYDARNMLAQDAVKGGYDYLLFLDSDITFPSDLIDKLRYHCKPIVSGVYYARRDNHFPVIFSEIRPKTWLRKQKAEKIQNVPNGLFEIKGCGMGCCLIKTEVLKKMLDKGWEPFKPMNYLGEDVSFCYRASKLGYKMYADSNIELGHIGDKIYTKRDYDERDNI